jgi:hypothetical protein
LQGKREESYFETLDMVVMCLSETIEEVWTMSEDIKYIAKLGGRKGEHPILVEK